jgi:hypothetical protein
MSDPISEGINASSKLFEAIGIIASKTPNWDQRRKDEYQKRFDLWVDAKRNLQDYAVAYNENSLSDVLLGYVDLKKDAEEKLVQYAITYASELMIKEKE